MDRGVLPSSLVPVDGSQNLDYLRNTDQEFSDIRLSSALNCIQIKETIDGKSSLVELLTSATCEMKASIERSEKSTKSTPPSSCCSI